jgi:hypothetical protein
LIENVVTPHLVAYLCSPPSFACCRPGFLVLQYLILDTWSHVAVCLELSVLIRVSDTAALPISTPRLRGTRLDDYQARRPFDSTTSTCQVTWTHGGPPFLGPQKRQFSLSTSQGDIIRRPAPCGTAKNATRLSKHTPQRSINPYKPCNGGTLYTRAIEHSRSFR